MSDLRVASYRGEPFPERLDALTDEPRFPQIFGVARALLAAGLVAAGWLAGLGALGASASDDVLFPALLAGSGAVLGFTEARRRLRAIAVAMRPEGLGIYRGGALVSACGWDDVRLHAPSGDATFYRLIFPGSAAFACGALAPRLSTTGAVGVTGLAVLLICVAASIVHVRHFALKFAAPLDGRVGKFVLRKSHGEAIVAAMPKTGGWRVAE